MLTRLKVNGFKNLVNVDVSFGAFTCITGANGVGKSNLFDAVLFLSALADMTMQDAAQIVRNQSGKSYDIRELFLKPASNKSPTMSFEAEMIVPKQGLDDLGQTAEAANTFLRYCLEIRLTADNEPGSNRLEILKETLEHFNQSNYKSHLPFTHSKSWRESVIRAGRSSDLISTVIEENQTIILAHQAGGQERFRKFSAVALPRTVLSASNSSESPTCALARNEMRSWHMLQLEPSSLRRSDDFSSKKTLSSDGSHLAATLERIHLQNKEAGIYSRVASRLSELVEGVKEIQVDRDEKRRTLTLQLMNMQGEIFSAQTLSDGTLRFIAFAALELDPEATGVYCIEEPENGIHPARISFMMQALKSIAMDLDLAIDSDNPLRQIIINTHSPAVVQETIDDDLLVAELKEITIEGIKVNTVHFGGLPNTWRSRANMPVVARGILLDYLYSLKSDADIVQKATNGLNLPKKIKDRPDLQLSYADESANG